MDWKKEALTIELLRVVARDGQMDLGAIRVNTGYSLAVRGEGVCHFPTEKALQLFLAETWLRVCEPDQA
jgi:hypothetical protein